MTLQAKLDAFRRDFEAGAPPFNVTKEIVDLQHWATGDLVASGAADRALKEGARAPFFSLPSESGAIVRMDAMLARGPLVLSFYRGVWCPYCNFDLEALQDVLPAIEARGANLVAISPQTPGNSRKSKRQTGAAFDILSDARNAVARRYGLVFKLPDYLIEGVYKPLGADLAAFNGDESWELPIPARFIVSTDGRIAYAEAHPDYKQRPEPTALIDVLDRLSQPA
ncbi:MAG: peroxiredoxin-like family protein [Pseudomonadota bacterium]